MHRGHYGIDPRKLGVAAPRTILPQTRRTTNSSLKRYNPYQTSSSLSETLPARHSSFVPSLGSSSKRKSDHKTPGKVIDKIFELSQKYSIFGAIEAALPDLLQCRDVYVWFDRPQKKLLYSQTLSKGAVYGNSILAFAHSSQEIIICEKPVQHSNYNAIVDGDDQLLYVPLCDTSGNYVCVLQFRRRQESPGFTQDDIDLAATFANKFKVYIKLLFPKNEDPFDFSSVLRIPTGKNPFTHFIGRLKAHFSCNSADIFRIDEANSFSKFIDNSGEFKAVDGSIGVSTAAAINNAPYIVDHTTENKDYDPSFDGAKDESVLVQPFSFDGGNYVIALRAPVKGMFNNADAAKLLAFSATVNGITSNSEEGYESEHSSGLADRLQALLYVAEALSGVLDIDALIPTIMTKACELLNTERCSLFLIDREKKELITRFQGGLDRSLRIPLSRGIVGHTATTGNIINIDDPYADPRFDQTVDRKTGFRTRNLVCVPIYNNRGDISGVTEMINKIDDGPFNEDDLKMLMAFNVFCGISLDNARLYQASLSLTNQLRSFISMSNAVNSQDSIKEVITEILTNGKSAVNASRVTVFLVQDDQVTPFVNIGQAMKHGSIFAEKMKDIKSTVIYGPEEVDQIVMNKGEGSSSSGIKLKDMRSSSSKSVSSSRVSLMLGSNSSAASMVSENSQVLQESICMFPLISSTGELLGVLEVSTYSKVMPEDAKLIDCFAVFAAITLERSELKEVATLGSVEKKIKQWMTPEEREEFTIPEKMRLGSTNFLELNFDAASFDDIGFFKVIFEIFNHFDLLNEYQITNEKFFRFLEEISATYKKVPYHNWRHAVDVTQYITYELETSGIVPKITKLELLALLVAGICHDANHDGFSNVYNVKAETPLGILFKNQSVMETHHCAMAISVISKDETNIFAALSPEDYKKTWSLIIKLILNTDMAKHFTFLKEVNALMDEGKLNIDDPDYKEYFLHLILKCADISNVSRPFNLANRWCDVLCEEFFRQGDLEAAQGMEYTSDLNDRAHLDKPKSQIGFYTFVCLPLYKAASRAMPKLKVNADQIESNLEIWKKQANN